MQVHTELKQLPEFRNSVVTIGSFDGVHTGHCHILKRLVAEARAIDGESIVVTFDPHPRLVLNPDDPNFRLVSSREEKIELLSECGVDHVVFVPFTKSFSQLSAREYVEDFLIASFQPRTIIIGYDHRFGKGRTGSIDFLKNYNHQFSIIEISAQQIDAISVSSTKIRRAIGNREIVQANRLLGRPYTLSGKVIRGNGIGKQLGFPTANIHLESPHKLIPPPGIYAAVVELEGNSHQAMLYIGDRPTLDAEQAEPRVEVNIIDFDGDLYEQRLEVQVIDFIRVDKKLEGLEALSKQISEDKRVIMERLEQFEANPNTLDVAVVILNYNTRRHLEEYLPTVIENSPEGVRIIVADNGSPDDSVDYLKTEHPDIELLDLHENYGFARGYNVALSQVKADIYVILNSDVEVTPNWIEPVLKSMQEDPTIAVAQPKILAWKDRERFEYAGASGGWMDALRYPFCRGRLFTHVEADQGQYDEARQCFWASGAAFFIRGELYHQFKGFDGDYFAHNEEIDLCWRLKRAGYSIWCISQSTVYHLGGGTLEYEKPRKVYLNFRNSLFSILKNERFGRLLWLIPVRLVLDGVAAMRFLLQGKYSAISAILRAHMSFYRQLSQYWEKRKRVFQLVEKYRIGPENREGIFRGSIIFHHFIRRKKEFSELPESKKSVSH